MTNRQRFFYNGTLLTLVGLAMRSVGMFFGALVSRAVGAEGVGLYTLIMTVYSFALTLAASGIGITVTRHVAEAVSGAGARVGSVMRGAFIYATIFGTLSFLLLFFGADFIGNRIFHDARTVGSLKILAFSLIPSSLCSVFSGYFVGVKRVTANAAVQVLSNLFKIGITLVLVLSFKTENIGKSVFLVCLGMTLTELVSFLLLALQYFIHSGKTCTHCGAELRTVAKTAFPLGFSAYVRSALLTLEHILIPEKLRAYKGDNTAALSDYGTLHGMALPMVIYPMAPLSSFAGLLVPEFAGEYKGGGEKRLSRICAESLGTTLSYAIVSAVMLSLFSEELGYVIYDSFEAGSFIALLAPIVPIMYLDHVTDSMLKGIGEQVYSMWVNIADSLLSVVLVCILIPKIGIAGYAVVIIVMEAFNFVLSFLRLRKKIKFKLPIFRSLIIPLISAAVAAYVTREVFVMCGVGASGLWLVLKLVFAMCIFFAVNIPIGHAFEMLSKFKLRIIMSKNANKCSR